MNLLYIIYTYNRPVILRKCLETLFGNTEIKPNRAIIIDDCSEGRTRANLCEFAIQNSQLIPIDIVSLGGNLGYGWTSEIGLRLLEIHNPKYAMIVESDYIFRKGWAEDALAVMEAKPEAVALSGYSNPDFFKKDKTDEMFPRIMREDFGDDIAAREFLHKPFELETSAGKIKVQGTTNSCGTFLLNWKNVKKLLTAFPEMREKVLDRCCNKQPGGNRKFFGDGIFSHGLSYYWYLAHSKKCSPPAQQTFDFCENYFETHFPWLDICDYSISDHKNGGDSINGRIVPEGCSFVSSPVWKDEYVEKNPRA